MLNLTGDWKRYLLDAQSHATEDFAKHERTGRPLGVKALLRWQNLY